MAMVQFARLAAGAAFAIAACLWCGCSKTVHPTGRNVPMSRPGEPAPRQLGEAPPEVVAADWVNTDRPLTLAALRGNVVLIEFWATWCRPCVAGIPHMNELQARYGEDGLRILGFTEEDREIVEEFQKNAKSPIEYAIGTGSRLMGEYRIEGIPHAILVGRDGKLVWEGYPADPECERKIVAALGQGYRSLVPESDSASAADDRE
jgi:thiol-disulfide isomerase/thioredoxin